MDQEHDGIWAIVFNEGKSFIGKVTRTIRRMQADWGVTTQVVDGDVLTKEQILIADRVTLCPVFDFFSPLRPVQGQGPDGKPQLGYARDPLVTPFDFTTHPVPLHVKGGGIAFLDEMHEDDQKTYRGFIEQATRAQVTQRAERAGIVLAPANGHEPKGLQHRR
jgi:hypothetical protein